MAETSRRSRANGELDFAAAGFHALEGLRELIEANLFGDEIVGEDVAAANGFERFADEARRVVERRNNFDFGVVDLCGLDFDELASGKATEEIDHTTATNHRESLLPGGGIAGSFDDGVRTTAIFG